METATKTKWNLDTAHSEIGFKVKHMMISNVSGSFDTFDVNVETDGNDFESAKVDFTADINSISTGSADRDAHLKSADFFDAATHPQLTFRSLRMEKKDEGTYELSGDLTIRGVTRPMTFQVEFGGVGKDPWGNEKAGFTLSGKVNRTDFGLNWNAALETGGVLVSDEVKLFGELELAKETKR